MLVTRASIARARTSCAATSANERVMQTVELEQVLKRAFQHHSKGQWQQAESLYRTILKSDPRQPQTLHLLGLLCFQSDKRKAAAKLLSQAVAIKPDNAEAQFHLAVTLQALGRLEDAVAPYRHAIALEPENAEAHNNLGSVQEDLGRSKEAVDSYRHAIAINPSYAGAQMNLGAIYRKHGRPEEAAKLYREALAHQPHSAELHYNLGLALTDLADPAAAAASFHDATVHKVDYAAAHEKLGDALREQARFDEALDSYQTALNHDPLRIGAHVNQAVTLHELGHYDTAAKLCLRALEIDPQSKSAQHNLAHCYWKLERFKEALLLFKGLDTPIAEARALECLFAMQSEDTFYRVQEQPAPSWGANLRIAAINAFAADQWNRLNPHPFCKRPLDFIRTYDLLEGKTDRIQFIEELIAILNRQTAVWEPFGKSTVAGFQTPAVLFERPEGPLAELHSLLETHITRYRTEQFDETCNYIDRFPTRYTLNGWYGKLVKGGHRLPHIHPSGWLSGVFYIQCPQGSNIDEGAIEFSLHGYGYPVLNDAYPRHQHRPRSGDLVLFPSSLFHSTVPIETEKERLVVAFDLVPLND